MHNQSNNDQSWQNAGKMTVGDDMVKVP